MLLHAMKIHRIITHSRDFTMKTKKTPSGKSTEKSNIHKEQPRSKSSNAYGDKIPICANTSCALRKKAKCSGFEGCPGFQTR